MSDFNRFPENWSETTAGEFARHFKFYGLVKSEFRQMYKEDDYHSLPVEATLFFFNNDAGVAVQHITIPTDNYYQSNDAAKFYSFGCQHEMEAVDWDVDEFGPASSCQTAYRCTKCGRVEVIDSSD